MRFIRLLAAASTLVVLAGCTAAEPTATRDAAPPGAVQPASMNEYPPIACHADSICVYATDRGGVPANPAILETNCNQEACGMSWISPGSSHVSVDNGDPYWRDFLVGTCNNGTPFSLASDATSCWDCTQGCAVAPDCPPGERCITIPRTPGSDCRRFSCEAGATMHVETAGFIPPTCWSPKPTSPPGVVTVTATTVNGRPRLSWPAVTGATDYRIYRKLEWQTSFDVWSTVTGTTYSDLSTTVSGSPKTWEQYPKSAGYYVVARNSVGEGSWATAYYYPYTGIAPY